MNGVVSLGDGGMATLVFETPIRNVIGFDFAVFENGFDNFLELAFVEVSSDSIHFIRFPSRSETSVNQQVGSFGILDPAKIHNLAGKYQAGYGTPFDLEELKDSAGLDINSVNYVRIIDVIGILDDSLGSRDATGTLVNDPYPTPFSTGGFDLDAVGVIRTLTAGTGPAVEESLPVVYPNPFRDVISIRSPDFSNALFTVICPASGRIVRRGLTEGNIREMNLSGLARGMYILSIEENMKVYNIKIIKQ